MSESTPEEEMGLDDGNRARDPRKAPSGRVLELENVSQATGELRIDARRILVTSHKWRL